jgi:hypothetical protein
LVQRLVKPERVADANQRHAGRATEVRQHLPDKLVQFCFVHFCSLPDLARGPHENVRSVAPSSGSEPTIKIRRTRVRDGVKRFTREKFAARARAVGRGQALFPRAGRKCAGSDRRRGAENFGRR